MSSSDEEIDEKREICEKYFVALMASIAVVITIEIILFVLYKQNRKKGNGFHVSLKVLLLNFKIHISCLYLDHNCLLGLVFGIRYDGHGVFKQSCPYDFICIGQTTRTSIHLFNTRTSICHIVVHLRFGSRDTTI